jgi:hypothetical protein
MQFQLDVGLRSRIISHTDQVSVHLADGFQMRLKCEKLTDDERQVIAKARIAFGWTFALF